MELAQALSKCVGNDGTRRDATTARRHATCRLKVQVFPPGVVHTDVPKGREQLTAAHENLVRAVLVAQLRSIALARLELDCDLLLVEEIDALEDDLHAVSNTCMDSATLLPTPKLPSPIFLPTR